MNAETIILITLLNFFAFHLINGPHSIGLWFRANYLDFCPEKLQTALKCSFCAGFWLGIVNFFIFSVGFEQEINPFWVPAFASLNLILAQSIQDE
jgi:hypothetical protein